MRHVVGLMLALALGVLPASGCVEEGGAAGSGGQGGSGGHGGEVCFDGAAPSCPESPLSCESGSLGAVNPCCELPAPPVQENACDGTESLENPAQCTSSGNAATYRLTVLELVEDCDRGFDLDACDGTTCIHGEDLGEGIDGVDNALAALVSPASGESGSDSSALNQAFADAICGLTGSGCDARIPALTLELSVDANPSENCARFIVRTHQGEVGQAILNLSGPTSSGTRCASGTLGSLPLRFGEEQVVLSNAVLRVTISDAGLSDGLLGATADSSSAATLAELSYPGLGAQVQAFLDIRNDLAACDAPCEALSGSYEIGGVAVGSDLRTGAR